MPNSWYTDQEIRSMAAKLDKISRQAISYYNFWNTDVRQPSLGRGLCPNDNWNVSQGLGTLLENRFLRAIGQGDKVTAKYANMRLADTKVPRAIDPEQSTSQEQSKA